MSNVLGCGVRLFAGADGACLRNTSQFIKRWCARAQTTWQVRECVVVLVGKTTARGGARGDAVPQTTPSVRQAGQQGHEGLAARPPFYLY